MESASISGLVLHKLLALMMTAGTSSFHREERSLLGWVHWIARFVNHYTVRRENHEANSMIFGDLLDAVQQRCIAR